tara:strand:+ start:3095 stop:4060 length:966 start_codon:yes stop_codon:yes gene_type:complete
MIKKEYLDLYKKTFLIRSVEEKISSEYANQKIRCPVHLSIGQELVPSALSFFLNKNDKAISTHRCHAHYLGKGGSLKKMIAELYGKKTGCAKGKGGSMHLIDKTVGFIGTSAIVAHNIPVGVGIALSLKNKKKRNIVVVYLGDGAVEEGVFFESINFAIIKKLPILFICENNFYSVYSALNVRQPKDRSISKMVEGLSIKSFSCNGYSVKNTFKILKNSTRLVKKGIGPIFVEFKTYRFLEHCGPNNDDELLYRNFREINNWLSKDPIHLLKRTILKEKILSNTELRKVENNIIKKISFAFKFAENSKFPSDKDFSKDIYV